MIGTYGDLIRLAVLRAGIATLAETIYAEDMYLGLDTLMLMLSQWQQRRWLVPSLVETVIPCTGAMSYSVGPTGDVPITRPDNIQDAFVRLLNQGPALFDYPMKVLPSQEDYNAITLKGLVSFPGAVFYLASMPLGQLFVCPVPGAEYELHIFTKTILGEPGGLSTPLNLPPEYSQAIILSLACALSPRPDPALLTQAAVAMNTIRNANAQVAELVSPLAGRNGRGTSLAQLMGGVW